MPKVVKWGFGVPLASWLLRCTVKRSKPRFGLKPASFNVNVSFCEPRCTVALTVGVTDGLLARQWMNDTFGNSEKCATDTLFPLAPNAVCTPTTADAATAASATMRLSFLI